MSIIYGCTSELSSRNLMKVLQVISFEKVKVTNNESDNTGQVGILTPNNLKPKKAKRSFSHCAAV